MSRYATNLIDCYFFSPDSGIVVGQSGIWPENSALILMTPDGGQTWQPRYTSRVKKSHAWKICFTARDTGFVSVQGYSDSVTYLKTSDRGKTWQEFTFKTDRDFSAQGICFVNSATGWIGPHPQSGRTRNIYQTDDGGISWQEVTFGRNINRFRMLSDTLGYAVGETIYKYTRTNISHVDSDQKLPLAAKFNLHQNYPNPFNPTTNINYQLPITNYVDLSIYNLLGQKVATLISQQQEAGFHQLEWDATGLASGVYYYRLSTDAGFIKTRKLMLLR